jgi:hypothetical protein
MQNIKETKMNKLLTAAFLISLVTTVSAEAAAPKGQRQNLGLTPPPADPISVPLNSMASDAQSFISNGEAALNSIISNTDSLDTAIDADDGKAAWTAFLTAVKSDMETWQTSACECVVLKNCDATSSAALQTFTGTPTPTGTDANGQPTCSFPSQAAKPAVVNPGESGYMAYAITQLPTDSATIGQVADWAKSSADQFKAPLATLETDLGDLISYNNFLQAVQTNWVAADNARKGL